MQKIVVVKETIPLSVAIGKMLGVCVMLLICIALGFVCRDKS